MAFDDSKMDSFVLIGIAVLVIPTAIVLYHHGWVDCSLIGLVLGSALLAYAWRLGRPWTRQK